MLSIVSLCGIVIGLCLLIFLAYKGHSIIWVAPLCAVVVAVMGGLSVLDAYLGDYIKGRQIILFLGSLHFSWAQFTEK